MICRRRSCSLEQSGWLDDTENSPGQMLGWRGPVEPPTPYTKATSRWHFVDTTSLQPEASLNCSSEFMCLLERIIHDFPPAFSSLGHESIISPPPESFLSPWRIVPNFTTVFYTPVVCGSLEVFGYNIFKFRHPSNHTSLCSQYFGFFFFQCPGNVFCICN